MTSCQRFEQEGLVRFVAGEPLDAHFDSCRDCQTARASYAALASALKDARDSYSPAGNWEAKVWARIQRGQDARRPRPWAAFAALGASAAALAVFFLTSSFGGPETLELATVQVERGSGATVRASRGGVSAAPGDVLHLVAKVPRGKLGDLRVYRGADEMVFACAKSASCVHSRDGLEARVTLDKPGIYRSIAIAADRELPVATGKLDTDYAAAMHAGSAKESPPVEVL